MKCLGIFCCAIVGLMVSVAEEIADLRLGSHASLSGQVLSIAPPGGVTSVCSKRTSCDG